MTEEELINKIILNVTLSGSDGTLRLNANHKEIVTIIKSYAKDYAVRELEKLQKQVTGYRMAAHQRTSQTFNALHPIKISEAISRLRQEGEK